MGQFVVAGTNSTRSPAENKVEYVIYPNPAQERIYVQMSDPEIVVYYITINNANGKAVMMLPQPNLQAGIDISRLNKGTYFLNLMDKATKTIHAQKFIVH